uniref:TIL domain-containing protein n=1 Tax=Trichuris muris TaxID=70415 RepID=A0A5S6QQ88_TRIMR
MFIILCKTCSQMMYMYGEWSCTELSKRKQTMKSVIFALLFFAAATSATQKCGPNEEFQECGSACPPTCEDIKHPNPAKICTLQCVVGCFCKQGYVLNADKTCVPASSC